jgi:hypothetical protein
MWSQKISLKAAKAPSADQRGTRQISFSYVYGVSNSTAYPSIARELATSPTKLQLCWMAPCMGGPV